MVFEDELKNEASDEGVFITDDELVERMEKLAWERDVSEQRLLREFCRYGVENYEEIIPMH